ncbi:MAG: hypothetical protein HGA95_02210 [Caldiserica bacterium]|nr:hypothetical protein [Caldisericota bacterium]
MTSFYRTQKIVFQAIDKIMKEHQTSKQPINIYNLVLMLTSKYEVGEKVIIKRLQLWRNANPDSIYLDEEVMTFE